VTWSQATARWGGETRGPAAHGEITVGVGQDSTASAARGGAAHGIHRVRCPQTLHPGVGRSVETIGNWYWIVDEIEAAGCVPKLGHARKAKLMMGEINKTDRLDVRGLNRLQRNGTLPTVWIPPGELRDQRDLPRTRMVLVRQRTQLKNRLHATLAKYALHDFTVSDVFGVRGRELLRQRLELLPPHTAY